jgi:WD40 repeat protein
MRLLSSCVVLTVLWFVGTSGAQSPAFEKAAAAWTLPWDDDWVTAVAFVGTDRLAAGNNRGDILVWNLPAPGKPAPLPIRRLAGHTNSVNRLLVTPDQRWLLSASNDHTIRVWDLQGTGTEMTTIVLNARAREEAASRKRKVPPPLEVKVEVQPVARVLNGHREWVLGLSQTRDGKLLVSGDDKGEVILWDCPAFKEIRRWKLKGWAWALAVSPDGKLAALSERVPLVFDAGRHSALKLWDTNTATVKLDLTKEFKGAMIAAAAFSPDGKWLAVGRGGEIDGLNGKATLLDSGTGKKIREFSPGHLNGLTDLVFHADGKHLLSCGRDTTVKVWHVPDGKLVKELGKPRGGQFKDWFQSLAISPDNRWIAAADIAGQVQVWALPK